MKKYKYLRIAFLLLPLIILGIGFFSAVRAADPADPSEVPGFGGGTSLGTFTQQIFNIGMEVAGGLAALAFIIGAVQYLASAGNPTTAGEGKNRMISAFLGLTLTLGSLIVLKSINPNFGVMGLKQNLPHGNPSGVYIVDDPGPDPTVRFASPGNVSSVASEIGTNRYLTYFIQPADQCDLLPYYFFITYLQENFKQIYYQRILNCTNDINTFFADTNENKKSYRLVPINPGVYLFADANCQDIINTTPIASSTNIKFEGAKSIIIVNSATSYYMVSEHENEDYEGDCTDFYTEVPTFPQSLAPATMPCHTLGTKDATHVPHPASLTIVHLITTPGAGNGITFYQNTEEKGGVTIIDKSKIENAAANHQSYKIPDVADPVNGPFGISETIFNYSGIDALPGIEDICNNLSSLGTQDCPGSASVYGTYVIKLKAENPAGEGAYCTVFSNDVENFYLDNENLFGGGRELKSMEILQGDENLQ